MLRNPSAQALVQLNKVLKALEIPNIKDNVVPQYRLNHAINLLWLSVFATWF